MPSSNYESITAEASTNLGANAGYIVKVTNANELQLAAAATTVPKGIIETARNAVGGECNVVLSGFAHVIVGATFTAGTTTPAFMSDAAGKAIPFVAAAGNYKVGELLNSHKDLAAGDVCACNVNIGTIDTDEA